MTLIAILSLIWGFLSNIPGIITLVKELFLFAAALKNPQDRSEHIAVLTSALRQARTYGNVKPLTELHEKWIEGIKPTDTVGLG